MDSCLAELTSSEVEFKEISKLAQNLVKDSTPDSVNAMLGDLKVSLYAMLDDFKVSVGEDRQRGRGTFSWMRGEVRVSFFVCFFFVFCFFWKAVKCKKQL